MATEKSVRDAEPVKISHTSRSIDALEWSSAASGPTIVVAVDDDVAELVGPVARQLSASHRVIGLNLRSAWDVITVAWWAADPVVVLAQGKAGELGCRAAVLAPGAIRALSLADYVPADDAVDHSGIAVPVLLFHGRESSAKTHAEAVKLKSEIRGSHLIELDGCAETPTKNCPTALAESLTWFLDELGKPFMDFTDFGGAEKEPVDPRK